MKTRTLYSVARDNRNETQRAIAIVYSEIAHEEAARERAETIRSRNIFKLFSLLCDNPLDTGISEVLLEITPGRTELYDILLDFVGLQDDVKTHNAWFNMTQADINQ